MSRIQAIYEVVETTAAGERDQFIRESPSGQMPHEDPEITGDSHCFTNEAAIVENEALRRENFLSVTEHVTPGVANDYAAQ
ncbi:hypothetical protein HV824_31280 [Myxococcus sp. AM009]|uniref:hypothetical protein n=1 Tax=Myxococcus sp. AM009 TaxID=2745137 RepID=UPI0015963717|nr:hypothetical protein [Myxococcus sp. AM009]NVJ02576.1 hypothetical protein [Myxococcus sp. AM009]